MQSNLIFFNSFLLTGFFASAATATPAPEAQTQSESEIPYLSEISLPSTQAELLTQDTSPQTIEENPEPDIWLDVISSPLVNFIEERQSSPTGVIIIDQREIQRFNHRTIGEVLRRQPGVVLGGPPGEDKDVQLLGLPKEYTQVLINGQRFPDGGENRELKVDRIPVGLVERIEIISNPTATIDSQGVAGTVNIILKKAPDERISDITITGTTLDSAGPFGGVSVLYGDRLGDFSYLITGGIQRRDSPKIKFKQTFDVQNRPIEDERENEDKRLLDISLAPNLVWRVSPRDTISLEPFLLRTEEEKDATRNLTRQRFFPSSRLQEQQQETVIKDENKTITGWRLGGHWERELSSTADMKLGLFFQRTDEKKDKVETKDNIITTFLNADGSPLDPARPVRNTGDIKREEETKFDQGLLGTFVFNLRPGENHKLTVGIEGNLRDREKRKITTEQQTAPQLREPVDRTNPKDIYRIKENQLNLYVQDEIRLGDLHTLTAGLRMETVNNTATAIDDTSIGQSGTIFNPSLHYKYLVFPTTVFRLSAARTIRRPKFDDLIPFRESRNGTLLQPDKVGNPNLRPETSLGVEAGIEQSWGNNTGAFGVNTFYRWVDDKIENDIILNPDINRFEELPRNVGNGKIYGVRMDLQTRTPFIGLPNLTLFGNLSFLGSEIEDLTSREIRRFKNQPSYVANLGFDYAIPTWGMNFGLNYNIIPGFTNRELKDGRIEVNEESRDNSLDAYIGFRLADNLQMNLFGKNLLASEKRKSRTVFNTLGELQNTRIERETADRLYGISFSWQF